jgi:MscS family membrane protein
VIAEGTYDAQLARLVSRVISVVGVIGIVLYGANEVGIPALGLLAGLGIGGLAIGLAAQGTVENLIGGLTLYADRPFRVGDFVAVGDDLGTVEIIGPRSTRISRLDGTRLSVPNSDVAKSKVVNYTRRHNVLFLHTIGVRYETTPEQLELLVSRIAEGMREHPLVVSDQNMPRVRVAGFGAYSIDIEVRAYVDTTDSNRYMAVQEQLLLMIYRLVAEVGTAIAYPSTTATLPVTGA